MKYIAIVDMECGHLMRTGDSAFIGSIRADNTAYFKEILPFVQEDFPQAALAILNFSHILTDEEISSMLKPELKEEIKPSNSTPLDSSAQAEGKVDG